MKRAPILQFESVQEINDSFLALWPHRHDFLWAEHPNPGESPNWQTEKRHPLSDRLVTQGAHLYGVRFDKTTNYALIDIDSGSAYHPKRDSFAISRILAALEPLGINRSIALSSSCSEGVHIYLPFAYSQKCSALALAIKTLLEVNGFKIAAGQLEIFPNVKPYIPNSVPELYNGHRLPLQNGSYLLNNNWEPTYSSPLEFVRRWQNCQYQNEVTEETIQQILKTYQRRRYPTSGKATKFLNDLNVEIELGWTAHGQTNHILGRIAMREYVFGHIFEGGAPLKGIDLEKRIVEVATALPGYTEWCRHQHEIHSRAKEWARCVEASRYYHYGCKNRGTSSLLQTQVEEEKISWNEQQTQAAREKIRGAIADMSSQGTLPMGITERFDALTKRNIGGSTLYRHRDLWHPKFIQTAATEPVEIPPAPPQQLESGRGQFMGNCPRTATNLLGVNGRNVPEKEGFDDSLSVKRLGGRNNWTEQVSTSEAPQKTAAQAELEQAERTRIEEQRQPHINKMQRYLNSGDPILMNEARAWAKFHPGTLVGLDPPSSN